MFNYNFWVIQYLAWMRIYAEIKGFFIAGWNGGFAMEGIDASSSSLVRPKLFAVLIDQKVVDETRFPDPGSYRHQGPTLYRRYG
jgi:hypothetical protein